MGFIDIKATIMLIKSNEKLKNFIFSCQSRYRRSPKNRSQENKPQRDIFIVPMQTEFYIYKKLTNIYIYIEK